MTETHFGPPRRGLYTSGPYAHGTRDEIKFLKGLGQYTHPNAKQGATRLQLLRNYLASMSRRKEWGLIDPAAVRAEVVSMIAAETLQRN